MDYFLLDSYFYKEEPLTSNLYIWWLELTINKYFNIYILFYFLLVLISNSIVTDHRLIEAMLADLQQTRIIP